VTPKCIEKASRDALVRPVVERQCQKGRQDGRRRIRVDQRLSSVGYGKCLRADELDRQNI
jgi:hypothetical protein